MGNVCHERRQCGIGCRTPAFQTHLGFQHTALNLPVPLFAEATRCLTTQTCEWCEVCQLICPDLCITRDPDSGQIQIDLDHCKGCGLCAHFCPKGALRMEPEQAG